MKKYILGLDLGSNSVGWSLVESDSQGAVHEIVASGSRIIPMDQRTLGAFESGNSISQTANRTADRGVRRLYERSILRRERLLRVLYTMNYLPNHYAEKIDMNKSRGQFVDNTEPKIAYYLESISSKMKYRFYFMDAYNEMLTDFSQRQPQLIENDKKVPYDWTIYYLRKKALVERISKEELAWVLLSFNQKRGYYQLRGEDEEDQSQKKTRSYFVTSIITDVRDSGEKYKGNSIFLITLESGEIGKVFLKNAPNWSGQEKSILITIDLDKEGNDRKDDSGNIVCRFKIPTEQELEEIWKLVKVKTESDLDKSNMTVGAYIYEKLLTNSKQKIRGKLIRTIERKWYKQELLQILETQKQFHPQLQDKELYTQCIQELYPSNETHKEELKRKEFIHLFVNDILFYQRPLKSKRSEISNCPYEKRFYIKDGQRIEVPLKCIAKSHPLYQEFRLWQFVSNLKIYEKEQEFNGIIKLDVDVTSKFLPDETSIIALYDWLCERKEIDQAAFLKYPEFGLKKNSSNYCWNFDESKKYPCYETRAMFKSRLSKINHVPDNIYTSKNEVDLWHILYSINDVSELKSALSTFARRRGISDDFVDQFITCPSFKKEYGAYSEKAIRRFLSLMRKGKYWNCNSVDQQTKNRISMLITGEYNNLISERTREKTIGLSSEEQFKGLPHWKASYVIYDKYSEGDIVQWTTPDDINKYLVGFKQHALRNPIVEKVVLETLRVVRDIWVEYGNCESRFFDEIHIELGREMRKNSKERQNDSKMISENENTNLRIKAMLLEFLNDPEIIGVRPYSPSHQDALKIYENAVLRSNLDISEDIKKISKSASPTSTEINKYKLWLSQRYRSPYTGEIIPLARLFTAAYQIDHIIPQSRFFDDSLSNKVICEANVNLLKGKQLGYEFICNPPVDIHQQNINLLKKDEYVRFVQDNYATNKAKMKRLLMDEIPSDFIQRQMNDTRYISRLIMHLLSSVVRDDKDDNESVSKNVILCTGKITSRLKRDWGLDDIWNGIVAPRFERMNAKEPNNCYGEWVNEGGKHFFRTQIPLDLSKGFQKKRIDHRHHSLDAIVIACVTRNHVHFLNNCLANDAPQRAGLRSILCYKHKTDDNGNYRWLFKKPWDTFTQDCKQALLETLISFKQNSRIITKSKNNYQKWEKQDDGTMKKVFKQQESDNQLVVRRPLHKETVYGRVVLRFKKIVQFSIALGQIDMIVDKDLRRQIKSLQKEGLDEKMIKRTFKKNDYKWNEKDYSKVEVYYDTQDTTASRNTLNESFTSKIIENKITDTGIQKILLAHLKKFDETNNGVKVEHPEIAFSADGIANLNQNIITLNNGKFHQPIYKVRVYEAGSRFNVGEKGNKKHKYVEAAKGTNLFFGIYEDENGNRSYKTIPFIEVVERVKNGMEPVPESNAEGNLIMFLSPYDLVYVPTHEELDGFDWRRVDWNDKKKIADRIYKVVSCTKNRLFCIPEMIASPIKDTVELGSNNKAEKSWDGIVIKQVCVKIKVDRLGNIIAINNHKLR